MIYLACRTTFAPILTSLFRIVVSDSGLTDRFWEIYYLAHYYCDPYLRPEKIDFAEVVDVGITGLTEEVITELRGKFEKKIERLRADEDKQVSFLMQLGLAYQYGIPGFPRGGLFVPAAIEGLENDYLFFRLLSQGYLQAITRKKFDLDPTDPAELRAPAIKQWQKWWEENKDKLHYDRMKDRLEP